MIKTRTRIRANLTLALHPLPLLSTDVRAEDEEQRRVDLLPVGQVGAKHWQLACASLLND